MTTNHVLEKKYVESFHLTLTRHLIKFTAACCRYSDRAVAVSLGGLAAEEPGEPIAWGSGRRDPDTEETPAEHADFNPRSAQEHEMETFGPASTKGTLHFHPPQTLCDVRVCLFASGMRSCIYGSSDGSQPTSQADIPHETVNRNVRSVDVKVGLFQQ